VAAKKHQVPYYGEKEFTPKTLSCWLLAYRREGFEGLKPKRRSDRGQPRKLTREQEEDILALRNLERELPASVFYDRLVDKGEILPMEVSYATVYRLLKKHGLIGKDKAKSPERKRFAYDTVNTLWQGDMSYGPYLSIDGKKVQTYLFAFIDDCSRVVPFAQFFLSEKTESLSTVFKEALLRRGLPKIVYVDNGKIFRSDVFQVACATLGIVLTHTQPYDAASKGKIERFFGTVKKRFLPTLRVEPASSLEELNRRFWRWLEEDYHRKEHSSLGMTPLDVYFSQTSRVRLIEDPASLDHLFLKREMRKVRHDGTISIQNQLFEVPQKYIGQRIEVRFNDTGVHIYEDGLPKEKAKPVNFADNAHVKRERTISYQKMLKED
ncbi:helix-turn-helix domain-containing protein, partial [Dethiobacter alkaliphilus]|uniref:helix-turn-helix domain-containing protein n=1 Tax=Dethiobacter alkaliphilus TaxID=427926 RepID=UPI002226E4FA